MTPLPSLRVAVIGAGPVGLALALLAARRLPDAQVHLFDARAADADVSGDARTLALALGSVQLLERLEAWERARAEPIVEVRVSQPPAVLPLPGGAAEVRLRAGDLDQPMLGAVLPYGALVAPMQRRWQQVAAREPQRLASRFGQPVAALKDLGAGGVEVDAGVAERFDLAVVAEGGVFGTTHLAPSDLKHDYRQNAWVGSVLLSDMGAGVAIERFTRDGPLALLPLPGGTREARRAALVWCVDADDDPVAALDAAQRRAVLDAALAPALDAGARVVEVAPLKCFALGLAAQRSLVRGRQVRIGNAAQTLHPVAGQGLNLGLRDAFALVDALREAEQTGRGLDAALARAAWQRAPDRWALIATTDFLARSFTWRVPGLDSLRALGLAALERAPPLKRALARQMMYGRR